MLSSIQAAVDTSKKVKLGAYLLSDDIDEAKKIWLEISKEDQQALMKQPIWKFAEGQI